MPDDAIEGVAEHSSRLQPSINLHAPITAFMFSCSGTGVLPRRDKGSGKPCAIEPHRILSPTRDLNQKPSGPQSRVVTSNHYTTTHHSVRAALSTWISQLILMRFPPSILASAPRFGLRPQLLIEELSNGFNKFFVKR